MAILQAKANDIPALETLLNSAYRGESSKRGWTSEAHLIKGELRTDASTLHKLMDAEKATFLKYVNDQDTIDGCVFLQKNNDRLYLGMLSVSPLIQAKGIGKQLMTAAEDFSKEQGCSSIFMKVISVRHELIAWYERKGYRKTGQKEPFPTDNKFGNPTEPLEFLILEKEL